MDRCILNGRFSQKQPLALATRYLWLPLRVVRQGGGNGCRLGTQSWYLSDHTFPMQFFRLWFCWLDSRHIYKWLGSWHPSGCVAKVRHLGVSLLGMNFLCVATTSERTWIMAWRFFLFQLKAICVLPRESSRTWDLLQGGKRAVAEGFGIRERDSHFLESHGVHSSSELLPVTWKYSTEDAMIMSACWHGPVPSGPFVSLALKLEWLLPSFVEDSLLYTPPVATTDWMA